jgi:hypothetical protein
MSTSISNSDDASEWGRCLVACLGTLALGALLVLTLVIAVDPYDTGRLGFLGIEGIRDSNARTANASHARDLNFDSAIIGNSHGQILRPADLSQMTGVRFVQLTVPGTASREQLAILNFFLRHHQHIGGVVIVTDEVWCTHDPALPTVSAFPFWLYGDSTLLYASRLFTWHAIGNAFGRIMIGLGLRKPRYPDGFSDYEELRIQDRHPDVVAQREPEQTPVGKVSDVFPAIALLEDAIKDIPAEVPLVLVVPPVFYTAIPRRDSNEAAQQEACGIALTHIVADRPRSKLINYKIDTALTRDPANFVDVGHYRAKIARKMAEGIAASILVGEAAKIDF